MQKTGILIVLILSINTWVLGQSSGTTCQTAVQLLSLDSFTVDTVPMGGSSFTPSCFGPNTPTDGHWYQFHVCTTGQLAWLCTPTAANVELDWALYNITNGCPTNANSANYVTCNFNYSGETSNPVGMSSTSSSSCPDSALSFNAGKEICPWETVTAGQTYAIFLNNYSYPTATGWNFNFTGSTFNMGPTGSFSVSPDTICGDSGTVSIANNSISATSQIWNFGDGVTDTAPNPGSHTYAQPGTYIVSLKDSSLSGCTTFSQKIVEVASSVISNLPVETICPGLTSTLSAPGILNGTYLWSPGGETSQSITVAPISSTTYSVTCNSTNNCTLTQNVTVNIDTVPIPTIIRSGDTLVTQYFHTYLWKLNSNDISSNQEVIINSNGDYQVFVTDIYGCSNTSAILNVTGLGVNSLILEQGITLYPNPGNGNFTVDFPDNDLKKIEITDAIGRTVLPLTTIMGQGHFSLNELSNGLYFLSIIQNNQVKTLKFSVAK